MIAWLFCSQPNCTSLAALGGALIKNANTFLCRQCPSAWNVNRACKRCSAKTVWCWWRHFAMLCPITCSMFVLRDCSHWRKIVNANDYVTTDAIQKQLSRMWWFSHCNDSSASLMAKLCIARWCLQRGLLPSMPAVTWCSRIALFQLRLVPTFSLVWSRRSQASAHIFLRAKHFCYFYLVMGSCQRIQTCLVSNTAKWSMGVFGHSMASLLNSNWKIIRSIPLVLSRSN